MLDRNGVIHSERDDLNQYKQKFANNSSARTLDDALTNADALIGVSGANLVDAKQIKLMAEKPIIFALSNPDPEIHPELALAARPDLIMATGRSDFPNQVNNVLGFPFIFRGALDVRATDITTEMLIAAVHALADLAHEPVPQDVLDIYHLSELKFGTKYILPKPFDKRLLDVVPAAVAKAAIDSGVALRKN
jgi:malate dehydrogenase (oxaloacetate-decarboxylating)(NADP+)